MYDEDIAACKPMGAHGAALLPQEGTVLTHCNAGALATCGYGTALGVIRAAVEARPQDRRLRRRDPPLPAGRPPHRLGAHERQHPHHRPLRQHGRPTSCPGPIQAVIVGADRIAANGDTANKIGTYSRRHPRQRARHPLLRRRPALHHRPRHPRRRRSSPSSSAPPPKSPTPTASR